MGRSGTTLLDKLLANHSDIDVLSQPLPLIFVEAKKRFLKTRGQDKYYVLNDDFVNRNYSQEEFNTFLDDFIIDRNAVDEILNKMESYSGQCTKTNKSLSLDTQLYHNYIEVMSKCLTLFDTASDIQYLGIKETMCEEFIPYLLGNNYKAIVIIRDPRDVLASANYPRKVKYLGSKKPALFILRTWRKSAEYIYSLKMNKDFHFLRYEDLVNHPHRELDKITDFLKIKKFLPTSFNRGILDRNGEAWLANTSFDDGQNIISNRSVGIYKNTLSDKEIKYTESICSHEMEQLGYQINSTANKHEIIQDYKDTDIEDVIDIQANYSSIESNIQIELQRLKTIKTSLYTD